MDDFIEFDEIQRITDEANKVKEELRHLIFLKSSGNSDFNNIDFLISEKTNELRELRFKLKLYEKMKERDEDDRYKNNTRK